MPKSNGEDQYVMDCHALAFLSQTKSNIIRDWIIGGLQSGAIKIPQPVWNEFCDAYDNEAEALKQYNPQKIRRSAAYRAQAGALASKANSGFRSEPYHDSDWHAAAVAEHDGCTLITVEEQCSFYKNIVNCTVVAITQIP